MSRSDTQAHLRAGLLREVAATLRAKGHDVAAEIVEKDFGLRRPCLYCGTEIPPTKYRHAKFCGPNCRASHSRTWTPEKAEYQRQWRARRREEAASQ